MKKFIRNLLGIVIGACVLMVLFVAVSNFDFIQSLSFSLVFIVLVIASPVFFAFDYARKIKRIKYLEEKLRMNNISFSPDQ